MGNTFTSWSGLVLALQQEVAEATAEMVRTQVSLESLSRIMQKH